MSPISPELMMSRIATTSSMNPSWWLTARVTPAFSAASTKETASHNVSPNGFSTRRWIPFSIAGKITSWRTAGGVNRLMISTSPDGIMSAAFVKRLGMSYWSQYLFSCSLSMSHPATTSPRSCATFRYPAMCRCAIPPHPTIPIRYPFIYEVPYNSGAP